MENGFHNNSNLYFVFYLMFNIQSLPLQYLELLLLTWTQENPLITR